MANPFEALGTAAQGYAQQKAASDPFALISQGLASTPIQVSNPWVNLASNLGRGLVAGGLSSVAGNRQEGVLNNANSQLYGHVLGGQPLTNPELEPYAQQVKAAFMADAYNTQKQEQVQQAAFQRALLQNQLGALYSEGIKAEMSPENQAFKARGLQVSNPAMSAYEQKIQAIAGQQPSDGRAAAMPEPRLAATTAPVTMQEIQHQIGTGAARPNMEAPSTMQQTTSPFTPPPNPNEIKNIRTMDEALRAANNNPLLAKEILAEAKGLREEEREEAKMKAPIEKENQDYLAESAASLTKNRNLISTVISEVQMAGETGGLPFDPGIEQTIRKTNLMVAPGKEKDVAERRLGAMQRMNRSAFDLAAEIKKAFVGNATEKEMAAMLKAGISQNNTTTENKAVIERMQELQLAAEASHAFVADKISQGMTKSQAIQAYNEYDSKVPLTVTLNTGETIVNPERLKGNSSLQKPPAFAAPATEQVAPTQTPQYNLQQVLSGGFVFDPNAVDPRTGEVGGYVRRK